MTSSYKYYGVYGIDKTRMHPDIYEIFEEHYNQKLAFEENKWRKKYEMEAAFQESIKDKHVIIRAVYRLGHCLGKAVRSSCCCCLHVDEVFEMDASRLLEKRMGNDDVVQGVKEESDDESDYELTVEDYAIIIQCNWRGYLGRELARRRRDEVLVEVSEYWRKVMEAAEEERLRLLAQRPLDDTAMTLEVLFYIQIDECAT
jgi:hypothetical protein